jgi:4'-phosphopantetheinyl transferase
METAKPQAAMTGDDIHVWFAPLDGCPDRSELLSPDERERADRFAMPHVRDRFVAARGFLRSTLAECLRCDPASLCFGYGHHGKPFLIDTDLRFNLSHSGGWAALAAAPGREVGIDIEQIRPDRAIEDLARRFFSAREWAALRALPDAERCDAFFRCWTRKEAFIKLIGDGLSFPLDEFEVTLRPNEPPALLSVRGDKNAAARWAMHEIAAPSGFAAAIVVEGSRGNVIVRSE